MISQTSSEAETGKFSSDVMRINNAHLWSTFVRADFFFFFSSPPSVSVLFICFPRGAVVIFKADVSLVAAGMMCRYFNE